MKTQKNKNKKKFASSFSSVSWDPNREPGEDETMQFAYETTQQKPRPIKPNFTVPINAHQTSPFREIERVREL